VPVPDACQQTPGIFVIPCPHAAVCTTVFLRHWFISFDEFLIIFEFKLWKV
jgi:hypothetical protein